MNQETTVATMHEVFRSVNATFRLDDGFIEQYIDKDPFPNTLAYVVYRRTYARPLSSIYERHRLLGEKHGLKEAEEWWLTVARVVEGVYRAQEKHCKQLHVPWYAAKAQRSARQMYDLIFNMKFLPPGRGLWAMGSPVVDKKGGACLNNCSFYSTRDIDSNFSRPFCFIMDMSMLGVGCGFDSRGEYKVAIKQPTIEGVYVVDDSREGWVDLIRIVLDSYVQKNVQPEIVDYSNIREAGTPIKGFGGTSSGPEPLKNLVKGVCEILDARIGKFIRAADVVDIMTMIGKCVVAGNVRRSALLALGRPDDETYLRLKDPEVNLEKLTSNRWAANNSVQAAQGMSYKKAGKYTAVNGEPGYVWVDNARVYGRLKDGPRYDDMGIAGANPCVEQFLESSELCCLVENFPARHSDYQDLELTLKYSYLYAKTVTLISTHDSETNSVMMRNRRIGTSMSGIVQAMQKFGRRKFLDMCDKGYEYLKKLDAQYSNWMCVPRSIKISTVKPSGSVSLLAAATPGIHFPHSKYYYRVVRFATDSDMLPKLKQAGYRCEIIENEPNTTAVYFPVKEAYFDREKDEISMWEQLELAAQMQYYWSDNAVSISVNFKPEEAADIPRALELYESRLKSVSFIPTVNHGYKHAPLQKISQEEYEAAITEIKDLESFDLQNEVIERFCDGDTCQL